MVGQNAKVTPVPLDFRALLDRHQPALLAFLRGPAADGGLVRDLLVKAATLSQV